MATKRHILIPHTTEFVCGASNSYKVALIREDVNCKICRRSKEFKKLLSRDRVKMINPKR